MDGYAELHAHSWFSFLDGASSPEAMAREAARLGLRALALTDHQTVAGAVRFTAACRAAGVKPILGAEVTVEESPGSRPGSISGSVPGSDPLGPFSLDTPHHLVLLAPDLEGWRRLCRILSTAGLANEKGVGRVSWDTLAAHGRGLVALTGCLRGEVPAALLAGDVARAERALGSLREVFGDGLLAEVQDHGRREEALVAEALLPLAARCSVRAVATGNAHYAAPDGRALHDVVTCIRHTCTLEGAAGLLRPAGGWHLASAEDQARAFEGREHLLRASVEVAERCAFDLDRLDFPLPDAGQRRCSGTAASSASSGSFGPEESFRLLARLIRRGAERRYRPLTREVQRQLDHELAVIRRLGLSGYFLLVEDLIRFARERGILVQGRGSAANSAVCYCLGVTAVDPIGMELLFERFLSEERREPPDIDLDIEHERREEVIQYVYERYGREHAAMVATLISYHVRSAVREVAKVLGLPVTRIERVSRHFSDSMTRDQLVDELVLAGLERGERLDLLVDLSLALREAPRHLGIHVGGMVICADPLVELTSVGRARMPGRSVVPWDKNDCGDLGMVKMDLLGLGMLTLLSRAIRLVRQHEGVEVDLAGLGVRDPAVYDLLCRADTVGVFQVESRAQMATLPRMRPRCFYDIVVDIALIRPGPIQGDMVHPYLRRRAGEEPVTCIHPLLEPALRRTLGVPLFQEQGMRVAMLAADFTPAEADQLRRAMGHKRSSEKMEALRQRLLDGMARNGIDDALAQRIYQQLAAFADYGFPESHAASFALIVYASAWMKLYHPAAFFAALLNSQPMGFYGPGTILADARRHGVAVLGLDARASRYEAGLEGGRLRPGWRLVNGIGDAQGKRLDAEAPYGSLLDFVRRSGLCEELLLRLARLGAFGCFGLGRRAALWQVKALARRPRGLFDALDDEADVTGTGAASLGGATDEADERDRVAWEYRELGFGLTEHPMALHRERLTRQGVLAAADLLRAEDRSVVRVAGEAVVKQRPPTAKGVCFLTLEDETGLASAVVKPQLFDAYRRVILDHEFLLVEGVVERRSGVVNVGATRIAPLAAVPTRRRPRRMYQGMGNR